MMHTAVTNSMKEVTISLPFAGKNDNYNNIYMYKVHVYTDHYHGNDVSWYDKRRLTC